MLGRGFETMTVPALKVDGRRIQGSREISRALDELVPQRPLFPADPQRARAVAQAERWGEELQDAARRIVLCAARRDPQVFLGLYRHAADFQIAPNIALLLRFADLTPFIEYRPAASHARRVAPDEGPTFSAVLPPAWLAPLAPSDEQISTLLRSASPAGWDASHGR